MTGIVDITGRGAMDTEDTEGLENTEDMEDTVDMEETEDMVYMVDKTTFPISRLGPYRRLDYDKQLPNALTRSGERQSCASIYVCDAKLKRNSNLFNNPSIVMSHF